MSRFAKNHIPIFVTYGNNPDFLKILNSFFSSKTMSLLPFESPHAKKADYLIISHDPYRESPSGFLNNIIHFLQQVSNSHLKILLIIQATNLSPPTTSPLQTVIPDLLKAQKLNYRTAVVWDLLFSPLDSRISIIDSLIKDSLVKGQINVSKTGNIPIYPLSLEDCLEGLSRSLFLGQTSDYVYTFGGSPTTDLDFALLLNKIFRRANIDLDVNQVIENSHSLDPQEEIDSTSALLNWLPKVELEVALSQYLPSPDNHSPETASETPPRSGGLLTKILKFSRKSRNKSNYNLKFKELNWFARSFLVFLVISFGLFILNLGSFIFLFVSSAKSTASAYQSLQIGDTANTQKFLLRSKSRLHLSQQLYSFISPTISLISVDSASNINTAYLLIEHANQALSNLNSIYLLGNGFYNDSISAVPIDIRGLSTTLIGSLDSFQTELTQISLLKKNFSSDKIIGNYQFSLPKNLESPDLSKLKNQINSAIAIAKLLPIIFPSGKELNYLIIFQDDNELRPTGGFINTYSLLSLTGNKLDKVDTYSSLKLDNSFAGSASPPSSLSSLLGESDWKFSDSNFYPDYPESASQSAWFFQKEANIKVDGVITINLSLIQNYLKYAGSITLPDGKEVSSENVRQLLTNPTQESSSDLFTDIITELVNQFRSKEISLSSLARSIFDSGSSSNLLIWLSDPASLSILPQSSFNFLVRPSVCPAQFSSSPCVSDTVYFNEANYSKNKANYYAHRLITDAVTISEQGSVSHQFSVDYSYPQSVPALTSSEYKSLIRFYLPQGSTLTSVSLDQQPLSPDSISLSSKAGLTQVEFPLVFMLNQTHRLVITFSSSDSLNLNSPLTSYSLTLLNQPGSTNTSQTVTFAYPTTLVPSLLSVPATINRQSLVFPTIPSSVSTYASSFTSLPPSNP